MQRLHNINKWRHLVEGNAYSFANTRKRNVRLEVNAPLEVCLTVIDDQGESFFLALVKGRDTVEFVSTGKIAIAVEGGDIWLYTEDSDDISSVVIDPVKFTRIAERRQRNPELEFIAAQMNRNMQRNLEKQAFEIEQRFARRLAAGAVQSPSNGDVARNRREPASADDGGPSGSSSTETD